MFTQQRLTNKTTGHIFSTMSKSEAKKQLILNQGLKVLMVKGYNGTGIKDVVDAAGVPKGSFYSYFESKEAFAIEAIRMVANDNFDEMTRTLLSTETSAKERLAAFFKNSSEGCCEENFKIGCFLGNMCQEMAANSDEIGQTIETELQNITSTIEKTLEQAQKDGDLDSHYDPASLADFLFHSWQGAMMRMKASSSRKPLDAFCQNLGMIFRSKVVD